MSDRYGAVSGAEGLVSAGSHASADAGHSADNRAPSATFITGNALSVMRSLEPGSIDCLISSPPYLNQRSYLAPDDPAKDLEMGQEESPGEFLEGLLTLMDEAWRVLSDVGTFWINLGDTHSGSGGAGGDYNDGGLRDGQQKFDGTAAKSRRLNKRRDRAQDTAAGILPRALGNHWRGEKDGWPLEQSVCWLPELFGASLAYGRNLLTDTEHRKWVTRPPVTWCKPNPSVGRLDRRLRTATELFIYGGKQQRHFFDLDAVRVPPAYGYEFDKRVVPNMRDVPGQSPRKTNGTRNGKRVNSNEKGAPPLNWWVIPAQGYSGAHFATFTEDLLFIPITAGCPVGGTILDPFAGTFTVGAVATGHGRSAIGIDLDPRNADLARERVGMWLITSTHSAQEAAS